MADFSTIIQEINDEITTNGVGAITGAKLNEVLRDMIAAVNAEKQDPLTIDATPTEDSTNPVQSGGVYSSLQQKPTIFYTPNIMSIPSAILDRLQVGDVVRYGNNEMLEANVVATDIDNGVVILVSNDGTNISGYQYQNGLLLDVVSFSLADMATRVSGATNGHLAGLDSSGNLTDSGSKASDFATAAQGGKADTAVQQVTVGTTTTGNAGTNASVTNSGTATAPVLDFTIPRGANGNDGHNPNLGTYLLSEISSVPAPSHEGDYIVVVSGSPATKEVYKYNTSAQEWQTTGADPDSAEFATGELVSQMSIDDDIMSLDYNHLPTSVAVMESIKELSEINLDFFYKFSLLISGQNKYASSNTSKLVLFPVIAGHHYKFTANANTGTVYAFLTSQAIRSGHSPIDGNSLPYCSGYGKTVVAAGHVEYITPPSDCSYIIVYVVNTSGVDNKPTVEEIKDKKAEANKRIQIQCMSNGGVISGRSINQYNNWANQSGRGYYMIDIPKGTTSLVVPQGSAGENITIAFLTSTDNTGVVPYFAAGSARYTFYTDGGETKIDVPTDAKYLYVYFPNDKIIHTGAYFLTSDDLEHHFCGDDFSEDWNILDTSAGTLYNNFICSADEKWGSNSNYSLRMVAIPSGTEFLRITPQVTNINVFILKKDTAPVSGIVAECSEDYRGRLVLLLGNTYIIPVRPDCKYIVYNCKFASSVPDTDPIIEYIQSPLSSETLAAEPQSLLIEGGEINDVEFNETPTALFTSTDIGKKQVTWPNVVKISDSMYFMYYAASEPDAPVADASINIYLAWSVDGATWNHSIPTGYENNNTGVSGNMLIEGRVGHNVVKVSDSEYPFRMICSTWHASTHMYKSADGVNWTLIKTYPYYYDNEPSVIVRGNLLKIYLRRRDGEGRADRYIGVVTVDLDGNALTPPTIFFGKYYYNAGASMLDDRREIMFPTYFNASKDTSFLSCFVVDGNKVYPKDIDMSGLRTDQDHWCTISPGIINIGSNFYVYYVEYNCSHNQTTLQPSGGTVVTTIKRAKVTFVNTGINWYPQ